MLVKCEGSEEEDDAEVVNDVREIAEDGVHLLLIFITIMSDLEEGELQESRAYSLCEQCRVNPRRRLIDVDKYKCPACGIRTCSLPCVNNHKRVTGCTGKRNVS